jgi:malate dehydrogenase
MKSAPDLPKKNFTAMLRLDHNRALSQIAAKTGKPVSSIEKLCVWGNHSPTMYADYRFATIGGQSVKAMIGDEDWNREHLPAHRRQARRGDHRGARPVVGGVGGERRDRPHARLGAGHERQVGDDGHPVRRQPTASRKDVMYGYPVTCKDGEYTMSRAWRSTSSAASAWTRR